MSDGQRGMEARRKRHEHIRALRDAGVTVPEIARRMGLTVGGVRYIINKTSQKREDSPCEPS